MKDVICTEAKLCPSFLRRAPIVVINLFLSKEALLWTGINSSSRDKKDTTHSAHLGKL